VHKKAVVYLFFTKPLFFFLAVFLFLASFFFFFFVHAFFFFSVLCGIHANTDTVVLPNWKITNQCCTSIKTAMSSSVVTFAKCSLNTAQRSILTHIQAQKYSQHGHADATYNIGLDIPLLTYRTKDECIKFIQNIFERYPILFAHVNDDQENLNIPTCFESLVDVAHFEQTYSKREEQKESDVHVETWKQHVFNLFGEPLCRFHFLPSAFDTTSFCRIIVVCHHLVADGYSLCKLLFPMSESGFSSALRAPDDQVAIPDVKLSSSSFANAAQNDEALTFWLQHVPEAVLPVEVPVRRDIPEQANAASFEQYNGYIEMDLWKSLCIKPNLESKSQEYITHFTWMLASLWSLWSNYINRWDFGIGVAFGGRNLSANPKHAFCMQNYAKVLPIYLHAFPHLFKDAQLSAPRTNKDAVQRMQRLTFTQLLSHTRSCIQAAKKYESFSSFDGLGMRSFGTQISLIVTQNPDTDTQTNVKRAATLFACGGPSDFNVYVRMPSKSLMEKNAPIKIEYVYKPHTISSTVVKQFHENWLTFLVASVSDRFDATLVNESAGISWRHLRWVHPEQEARILYTFNHGDAHTKQHASVKVSSHMHTLHGLFETTAQKYPANMAVIEDSTFGMSYSMLNETANALASRMMQEPYNIKPADRVVLLMPRSLLTMQVILAVLKLGATYVPVDSTMPLKRIEYIIGHVQPTLIVLGKFALESSNVLMPWLHEMSPTIPTMHLSTTITECLVMSPKQHHDPRSVAYIIFTSGSTGNPKGVEVFHQSASNTIHHTDSLYKHSSCDKVLQSANLSFDVSVWQIFNTFRVGASLVLLMEAGEWQRTIINHAVTTIEAPPSVLTAALDLEALPKSLKYVQLSGEPSPLALIQKLTNQYPHLTIVNGYGPTESSIYANMIQFSAQSSFVPIGPPVKHQRCYILNDLHQLVPEGVPGIIWMAGLGPARGYFGLDNLTHQKFLADKFAHVSESNHAKMYNSGDLGRWTSGGIVECLGRNDQQVKWHGYRIELGEIESCLMKNPHISVRASAAKLCTYPIDVVATATSALVAYVVVDHESVTNDNDKKLQQCSKKSEILSWLALHLPKYMIPTYICFIDALPVSTNGKLDRALLPVPAEMINAVMRTNKRNHNKHKRTTSQIPTDVLKRLLGVSVANNEMFHEVSDAVYVAWLQAVGPYSSSQNAEGWNFFEQGGNSLSAMKMVVALCKTLPESARKWVSVAHVYQYPLFNDFVQNLYDRTSTSTADALNAPSLSIAPENASASKIPSSQAALHESIAIIGMSGLFPGASDIHSFWHMLCEGSIQTGDINAASAESLKFSSDAAQTQSIHTWKPNFGKLPIDLAEFDPTMFGMRSEEAIFMDPQHRLLLQQTYQALEDARISSSTRMTLDQAPVIGVYVTAGDNQYWQNVAEPALHREAADTGSDLMKSYTSRLNNSVDQLASRIAYHFNCTGPTLGVQSACSSSISCLSVAVDHLRLNKCDIAIVAATRAALADLRTHEFGYWFQEGMIFSKSGRCRPFDATSDGTVPGNAIVTLILTKESIATTMGSRVYAYIDSAAVGNNGRDISMYGSFSTPSAPGQIRVLNQALHDAQITSHSLHKIGFIEAHGTGTAVGDAVEWSVLQHVFGAQDGLQSVQHAPCFVGAVKANIGHTDAAAGLVGIVKSALVLFHGHVPPQPGVHNLHPGLQVSRNLCIPTQGKYNACLDEQKTHACVQSIGMGGTNGSVILRRVSPTQAHQISTQVRTNMCVSPYTPILWRGRSSIHARKYADALMNHVADMCAKHAFQMSNNVDKWIDELSTYSVMHCKTNSILAQAPVPTTNISEYRLCVTRKELQKRVQSNLLDNLEQASCSQDASLYTSPVYVDTQRVLLFGGQGSFKWTVLCDAYNAFAPFKSFCDEAFTYVSNIHASSERTASLFDQTLPDFKMHLQRKDNEPAGQLWTSILLFITQMGMWKCWRHIILADVDVQKAGSYAVLGHSLGEFAAACVVRALHWKEAIRILHFRIKMFCKYKYNGRFSMVVVRASEKETKDLLMHVSDSEACVACVNTNQQTVVTGTNDAISTIIAVCHKHNIKARMLTDIHVPYHWNGFGKQFHDDWVREWETHAVLGSARDMQSQKSSPRTAMQYISGIRGAVLDTEWDGTCQILRSSEYWWQHISNPVQFVRASTSFGSQKEMTRHFLTIEVGMDTVVSSQFLQNVSSADPSASHITVQQVQVPTNQLNFETHDNGVHNAVATMLGDAWKSGLNVDWTNAGFEQTWSSHDNLKTSSSIDASSVHAKLPCHMQYNLPQFAWDNKKYWPISTRQDTMAVTTCLPANAIEHPTIHTTTAFTWSAADLGKLIRTAVRSTFNFYEKSDAADNSATESNWLHANFFEHGNDSIQVVTLIHKLSKADLRVQIAPQQVYQYPTCHLLENYVREQVLLSNNDESTSPAHVVMLQYPGCAHVSDAKKKMDTTLSSVTVFMIPPGGGTLHLYNAFVKAFENLMIHGAVKHSVTIIGLLRPTDVAYVSSVESLAHYYTKQLLILQPEGTYHLCGGSYGGMVAFEMAQLLAVRNKQVASLIMLDTPSAVTSRFPRTDLIAMIFFILQHKHTLPIQDLQHLHSLPALRTYVQVKTSNAIKSDEEWEQCIAYGNILEQDIMSLLAYTPKQLQGTTSTNILFFEAGTPRSYDATSTFADWKRFVTIPHKCTHVICHGCNHMSMYDTFVDELKERKSGGAEEIGSNLFEFLCAY
jgi:amino acid adenylation domain-containing protein